MQTITTIGLDIAKSVFQVHGVDNDGKVVIRRQLKRRYVLAFFEKLQPCLVGIEACASSHHWSRELQAPGAGRAARGGRRLGREAMGARASGMTSAAARTSDSAEIRERELCGIVCSRQHPGGLSARP
jgi:hypothetical protein